MPKITILALFLLISFSFFAFGNVGDSESSVLKTNKFVINQSISEDNSSTFHTSNQFKAGELSTSLSEQLDENSKTSESIPVSKILSELSATDKSNAIIQLEVFKDLSQSTKQTIERIESVWNNGNPDKALIELKNFEKQNSAMIMAVGISWKVAKPMAHLKGVDVQVSGRLDVRNYVIDFHESTGNIFAVMQINDTSGTYNWSVNLSTDGGATWSETYDWWSSVTTISDVNAAIVGDYLYIGYTQATTGRIRRCMASDGIVDGVYGWQTVIDDDSDIEEIAIASLPSGGEMYYVALAADDSLHYFFSTSSGATWTARFTGITNASHGLDAHNNENSSNNTFIIISYVATDGRVHCATRGGGPIVWNDFDLDDATTNTSDVTSVAAWQDTILIVYENLDDDIEYRISYNTGTSWLTGTIASDPTNTFNKPHVAGRKNGGFAVVYSEEAGAFDPVWYRHRTYAFGTGWSTPVQVNEIDCGTAMPNNIEWIPPFSEPYAYGTLFNVSFSGYFDRVEGTLNSIVGDNELIISKFKLSQNFPNPFNPSTTIKYQIANSKPQNTTLQIFNSLGQLVRSLVNTEQSQGEYSVVWNGLDNSGTAVSSGVYFYKLTHGNFVDSRKLLKLK
jgi:flagellar hook capping protein FlgD